MKANCFVDINGLEGLYKLLDNGQVWSVKRKKFLTFNWVNGSAFVYVAVNKVQEKRYIRKLLKEHFGEEVENEFCESHKVNL